MASGKSCARDPSSSHFWLLCMLIASLALHAYRSSTDIIHRKEQAVNSPGLRLQKSNTNAETVVAKSRQEKSPPAIAVPNETPPNQPMPPRGKSLSLDIVGASFDTLNDEQKMKEATLNIVKNVGLTSLGISSFKLNPMGVSLVAATSDGSHIIVQTWPEHAIAVFDFTTRQETIRMQDILPMITEQYGGDLSNSTFSIIPRGDYTQSTEESTDLLPYEIMGIHRFKKKVFEKQSPFQHVGIWEHHDMLDDGFSKETTRSLFLDGVAQSNVEDESKYHETLVHPAFIASEIPPKRVLIVGGGEGATLRECLKWASVETVTMVDLDADVVMASREFLPSYNNCTGFGSENCFDDPRTELYTEDFIAWFDKHIGNDICDRREEHKDQLYDVVIVDLLDTEELPEGQEWAEHLYSDLFYQRISCAMNRFGVITTQFGEAPSVPFASVPLYSEDFIAYQDMMTKKINQMQTMSHNFKHNRVYESFIPSFRGEWTFATGIMPEHALIDSKYNTEGEAYLEEAQTNSNKGVNSFDGTAASVNLKLKRGLKPGGFLHLKFYDGAIQHQFRYPRGRWQDAYCLNADNKQVCDIPTKMFTTDYEEDWFEPSLKTPGADGKSGFVAKRDIKKGHISGLWDAATAVDLSVTDIHNLKTLAAADSNYSQIFNIFDSLGHGSTHGATGDRFYINMNAVSLHSSVNHACDHKPNTGSLKDEMPWSQRMFKGWNPVTALITSELDHLTITNRDIAKGEMITEDYFLLNGVFKATKEKLGKRWCTE